MEHTLILYVCNWISGLKHIETDFPVMVLVLSSPRKNASYVNKSEWSDVSIPRLRNDGT
jgi:hypothetical protein